MAFVAALLYWEQAALLYVISTLAVCGLLLVVAFSKVEMRSWRRQPGMRSRPLRAAATS